LKDKELFSMMGCGLVQNLSSLFLLDCLSTWERYLLKSYSYFFWLIFNLYY